MPRALVVCEFASLNGGERSLLAVLPHLQQAGWLFDFLAPTAGPLADELRRRGIDNVATTDWGPQCRSRPEQIVAAVRARRYDVVHANSLSTAVLLGSVAAELALPTIGHLRDIVRLSAAKIAALNGNTRLLAVSAATRSHHVAQGLDPAKSHVLHNGVDLAEFRPRPTGPARSAAADIRRELGLPPESQLIAIVGQIILRKGQDVALKAVAGATRDSVERYPLIIGVRHSEKQETLAFDQSLYTIAREFGIADRMQRLGGRRDVSSLLPQCSVLVHMARQEPLGRALLEAAACGVPIVATSIGGTPEIFPRGADDGALLVPVDDVAACSAAVERILSEPDFAARLGQAGRRRIEEAFSVETAAAGLLKHYEATVRDGSV